MGAVQKIGLGNPPAFYYDPTWSPDSKKIAYEDSLRQLWYIDLEKSSRCASIATPISRRSEA